MNQKTLFIGAGNMGSAILEAGITSGILQPKTTFVVDSNTEKIMSLQKKLGIQIGNPGDCDTLLLAVKPQSLKSIFPLQASENPLLISILAGTSCRILKEQSKITQVIRVMPNTPALVQSGVSGIYFSNSVSIDQKQFCQNLFSACGEIIEIKNEDQMHAITALSGSGPAYFFQFVEHLANAGEALGLSPEVAEKLAVQTCIGSAKLLSESKENVKTLREKVTSPGGTTFSALEKFKELNFQLLVQKAVESAEKRSRELGE